MEDISKQNIIKSLGIDTLPEKEQEEVLLKVGTIIFQSVLARVMDVLEPEEKDQFTKILTEKPDDEKAIMEFLESKVSNLDEIVNEEVANFKKESLDFMDQIEN